MSGFTGGLRIKVKQVPPPKVRAFRAQEQMFDLFVEQAIDKIKLANSSEMPSWLSKLIKEGSEPFAMGGYKRLYQVGGMAISVEVGPKAFVQRRKYVLPRVQEALRFLPLSQQKVVLGKELKEIPVNDRVSVLFSRLDLCEMNIWDFMRQMQGETMQGETRVRFYKYEVLSLILSLYTLHEAGMYLLDIKPENMLVCNGSIYWSDVEDLVFLKDETVVPTVTRAYSLEIYKKLHGLEFLRSDKLRGLKLSLVDWYAFCRSIHDFSKMRVSVKQMPKVLTAWQNTVFVTEKLYEYNFGKKQDQVTFVESMVEVVRWWESIAEDWLNMVKSKEATDDVDMEEKTGLIKQGEERGLKF